MRNAKYICPMHPDVRRDKPGSCPKCGMDLVEIKSKEHSMKPVGEMPAGRSPGEGWNFWEKLKMGLTMTMGMEHGGLAGREMAKLMEEDIRNKFFFSVKDFMNFTFSVCSD